MQALAQLFILCFVERYEGRILLSFKRSWIIKCKVIGQLNLCDETLTCNPKDESSLLSLSQ